MANPFQHREEAPVGLITITVMLGLIMAIIDSTIVNVALNTIGGNLGASTDEVAWVATGYILANVIVMPLNGWLTALLGRKRFYAISLAVFTITSLLCGTAHTIGMLIFYRVLQGLGGGALQPTAQAIMFETYPAEKRGQAMAIFGIGAMVGPAVGPTLGGWIVDNATWPLIFYINIPIGIVAFIMTLAYVPTPKFIVRLKGGIDWIGLGLLSTGLASLQYVLERGEHDDWFSSDTIVILSIVAVVTLTWFIWKTLKDKAPLVDLNVFKFRSFTIGSIIGVIMGFGLFGTALILPLFFQTMLNFTAFDTGMALLPGALATAVSMMIVGRLANRIDGRMSIAAGLDRLCHIYVDAWGSQRAGGLLGRLLAAADSRIRAGRAVRAADDDVARRRPGARTCQRDRRVHADPAARRQFRYCDSYDARRARICRGMERAGVGRHADAGLFGRNAHGNGSAAVDDDRVRLRVPHLRDRVLARLAASLLHAQTQARSKDCGTGTRRRINPTGRL